VTYQPAQIQDLIRAIDEVLGKSSPRLPWVMSGETDQQRRVLEETRRYLAQMQLRDAPAAGSALAHDPMNQGYAVPLSPVSPAESAQQVLQAMLQEMTYLRTTVMQPLRNDLEVLYRQRDRLLQEIHELETRRQQTALTEATPPAASLPAADQQRLISEFLQTLMGRLQADLSGQVAQMLTEIEAQAMRDRPPVATGESQPATPPSASPPSATEIPILTPAERLQQIQRIQAQSDQLLLKLDNSLRVIFESLQSNIETYQESLSLGLDKMNTLGQQGESIFAAMVNRLAEQLSREASHYLQASIQDAEWQPATSLPQSPAHPTTEPQPTEQWPPASLETAAPARPPADSLDPIDQLLSELEEDLTVLQVPEPNFDEELTVFQVPEPSPEPGASARESEPVAADTRPMSSTVYPGLLDEIDDLEALELLTQELERLDLASVPELPELEDDAEFAALDDGDEDLTMFQIDESGLTGFQTDFQTDFQADGLAVDPRTVLQVDAEVADEEAPVGAGLSIEDLDSALDLLGQISTQLDAELEQAESIGNEPDSGDRTAAFGADADSDADSGADAYDDLDAFYESLFGVDADESPSELADSEPVDQHLSDAEQRSRFQSAPDLADLSEPDLADELDLTDTRLADADLGSLDSLDDALFGGQADPATDADEAADAAIASPSVDELVELLGEFMNPPAAEPAAETQVEQPELQPLSSAEYPAKYPAEYLAEYPAERSPEAVEHLLFGEEPEPPPVGEQADDLPPNRANKPEVIRSLNDLLQFMEAESADELAAGLPANGLAADADDRYEPANPGEDLLGGDDVLSSLRPDVQVNQAMLEQLAADLSGLEGLAADAFGSGLVDLGASPPPPALESREVAADSLADWLRSPDLVSGESSVDTPPDEGQSYWQGGSSAQSDLSSNPSSDLSEADDLFIASLFPVDEASDDEMTLLLDGPPPGLSGSPPPEKASLLPTTPESLADWVNALDTAELPPDREDLSLSDFQAVMETEIETAPRSPEEQGAIAADQAPPAQLAESPSAEDLFPDELFADDPFSGADSAAAFPADAFPNAPADSPDIDSASLDEFSDDFAASAPTPASTANQLEPAPPSAVPDSLEDLFADLPAPAPQPGATPAAGILENLSLSVPAPPPGETAFTLSGLESLFEDVPSVGEVTPVPPPGSPNLGPTAADLSSLFDDAEPLPAADPAPVADPVDPTNSTDQAPPADSTDSSDTDSSETDSSGKAKKKFSNPRDIREPRGFGRLQPNTRRPQ
jgi:hypothetical protein